MKGKSLSLKEAKNPTVNSCNLITKMRLYEHPETGYPEPFLKLTVEKCENILQNHKVVQTLVSKNHHMVRFTDRKI